MTTGIGPEALPPEIREAIAVVVDEIWDREKDDHQQQDHEEGYDHPFHHLTTLHRWLGPYSPIRDGR